MKDLSHYRRSYEKNELTDHDLPESPLELFSSWFQEIEEQAGDIEANAMTVATIGMDGFPKSRVVLLKQLRDQGFVFFTNYNSDKGKSISQNQNVCLSFFWPTLERQVIIKGIADKTSEEISDDYFKSRPEGSQLSAIVSNQSQVVGSRSELEQRLTHLAADLADGEIPRPKHWGGYIVKPLEIEFWQGRADRLHDRIVYKIVEERWQRFRLEP